MKELFLDEINRLYNSYVDFDTLLKQMQKEVKTERETLLSKETPPAPEELEKMFTNYYVDLILLSQDTQLIRIRLAFYLDLYVQISQEDLPEGVKAFYKDYKQNFPKQSFVMKDGNLMESEDGKLEKARAEFLDSEFYKSIAKTLS